MNRLTEILYSIIELFDNLFIVNGLNCENYLTTNFKSMTALDQIIDSFFADLINNTVFNFCQKFSISHTLLMNEV